jgi:RHS repeat-associated protein
MTSTEYSAALKGDFRVDQNGSAVYSIGLQVPPGTAGMQPSLSLIYHSTVTDGMLGVGWNLSGVSAITRVPQTPAQDHLGRRDTLHFDARDRFSMDGQRLMVVAGAYGAERSEYRTELNTFSRVTARHITGESAPASFFVEAKGGLHHEYGGTPDACIRTGGAGSPVRAWAMNRMTDRCGNFLTISYRQDPVTSAYYPNSIEYTGNAGFAPQRKVEFTYEARPRQHPRFEAGYRIDSTLRLKQIRTSVLDKTVLTYMLDYGENLASGRSQLLSVVYADAAGRKVLPTTFDWLDIPDASFEAPMSLGEAHFKQGSAVIPVDVGATGRRDLIGLTRMESGGLTIKLLKAQPGQARYAASVSQDFPGLIWNENGLIPLDMNGDGATELLHVASRDSKLALTLIAATESNGVWSFVQGPLHGAAPLNLPYGGSLVPMDVNGDGRVDLVYCYADANSRLRVQVLLSDGTGFVEGEAITTTLPFSATAQLVPVEFNGDGMTDLLYAFADQSGGKTRLGLRVFVSNGKGMELRAESPLPSSVNLPYGGSLMPVRLKDDAQEDLLYAHAGEGNKLSLFTLFGTGVEYRPLAAQSLRTELPYNGLLLPSSARGSGLTELVVGTQSSAGELVSHMLRWNGNGFDAPVICIPQQARRTKWGGGLISADVSGRGKTDLLYGTQAPDGAMKFELFAAPSIVPGRLHGIRDGFGGRIEISYKPMTDPTVYSKGTDTVGGLLDGQALLNGSIGGSSWAMRPASSGLVKGTTGSSYALTSRQFPEYVVAGYVLRDNRGSDYRYEYRYTGCRIDMTGRGWLGFAAREAIDVERGLRSTEAYQQIFPTTGLLTVSTLHSIEDNALLMRTTSRLSITGRHALLTNPGLVAWNNVTAGKGVFRTEVAGLFTERFTAGRTTPDITETETDTFDNFGNLTFKVSEASKRAPVYRKSVYRNDETTWDIGIVSSDILAADADCKVVLTNSEYKYDSTTGRQTEERSWDDRNSCWLVSKNSYDRFGNGVSEINCSGAVTETVYDSVFQTFPVKKILPANAEGKRLELVSVQEPGFGIELSHTDANGIEWTQTLDGIGRVIETRGPDEAGTPFVIAQYTWSKDEHGFYAETRRATNWSASEWYWRRVYSDSFGREYRVAGMAPEGVRPLLVDRVYTATGEILKASLPYFEGDQPVYSERRYDAQGRVRFEIEPVASGGTRTIETAYPRLDLEVKTDAGRITTKEYTSYNGEPALLRHIDPLGAVSTFAYDVLGRLTSAIDPMGIETQSHYDTLGRRVALKVKQGEEVFASEEVARDDRQRTTRITSHSGNVIEIVRDARDRIVQRTVNRTDKTLWLYDVAGVRMAGDRLALVQMPNGSAYRLGYDRQGNLTDESLTLDGETWTTRRAYSAAGVLLSTTHPDGSVATGTYTGAGQLKQLALLEAGSSTASASVAFSEFNTVLRPQSITYGNGLKERVDYNRLGQIRSQALKSVAAVLDHTEFQWDEHHALKQIDDRIDGSRTQRFEYDSAGRLIGAERAAKKSMFGYDDAGNLLLKDGVRFTYKGQQAVSGEKDGEQVFQCAYTADGNIEKSTHGGEAAAFRYDGLGQLLASGTTSFQYDYSGRRVIKRSAEATTFYITSEYEVTVFAHGARECTRYLNGLNGPIAQSTRVLESAPRIHVAGVPTKGIRYLHTNQINSTILHTDASGEVAGRVEYKPFGEIESLTGEDDFRRKFTGKELDHETGLYYFHARYYDPRIGRFMTGDDRAGGTVGTTDSLNRYAYVLNNPITGVDFDGHFRWDIVLDVVLAVAAVSLIAAGTVLTGGAAAPLLGLAGSVFLGAATSGIFSSIENHGDDANWGQWGTQVGIGAATGLLTGGLTGGGIAAGAKIGARVALTCLGKVGGYVAQIGFSTLAGAVSGSVSGLIGNGLRNLAAGRSFTDNFKQAMFKGAWQGAISGGGGSIFGLTVKPWIQGLARGAATAETILGYGAVGGILTVVGGAMANRYASHRPDDSDQGIGPRSTPRPAPQASLRFTPAY